MYVWFIIFIIVIYCITFDKRNINSGIKTTKQQHHISERIRL